MSKAIVEMTVCQLGEKLRKREISAAQAAQAYLEQIENKDGAIGAYLTVTAEQALKAAHKADERLASGEGAPLTGIPVGIKDNICTRGVVTTCASKMLEGFVPPYNAHVIERLEEKQTVLLGKLNMDEFAMGGTTENSYFQVTRNPRNLSCVPGGSSGGSAAAVAANEAAFSLGSDTGGSIRQPAAFCGVVGMKPTYGSVSRNGLVAFASSLDQIGPITKDVRDNALVLNVLTGHDPGDSTSVCREYGDYTARMEAGVKGMKIALPKELFDKGLSQEVREKVLNAAKVYQGLGAEIIEVSMTSLAWALPAYYVISSAEASSNLARFDGVRYGYRTENYSTMEELYKNSRSEGFGREVKRRIMLGTFALSSGYYDAYYKKALQARTLIVQDFQRVFADCQCILAPVAPTPAYKFGERSANPLEMYMGDVCTVPVNIAGLPALSLPCGETEEGLPVGMQLIGAAFEEAVLYQAAYAFEQSQGAYHLEKASERRGRGI